MDTFVMPEHRGRKFMRIVSNHFQRDPGGLTPHWDTFVSNVPSYVLAQTFRSRLSPIRSLVGGAAITFSDMDYEPGKLRRRNSPVQRGLL